MIGNNSSAIGQAHARIKNYIHRTPVMSSRLINTMAGCDIYFKCENFQRMGAFKMRGAINAALSLSESQRSKGILTHSSGNMAQAVALSAQLLGIPAYIVMPENAPQVKKNAVASYGGQITLCESTIEAREAEASRIQQETGAWLLHPSNHIEVIHGQGTAAYELIQDNSPLDFILTPVGGGGLLAGTVLAANELLPDCRIVGAEPMEADDAYRSLKSGKIEYNSSANTIADGLRTHLGDVNFPIIKSHVGDIIRVEEEEIISAMRLIWERMKIIIEPSCAVPLAAVLRAKEKFKSHRIGIILSGGNVDLNNLPF
ncbi:MAG: pyridoxal-phosphate dependent enzyme [Saprospiraceae bacterium]|jgi:threonine dehydratase|nr:pyridoxal-phosphate dependent enzyme [Chitinophagia bacterium]